MALGQEFATLDAGPGVVNWDPDTANLNIYPTNGSILFKSELEGLQIYEDGHGNAPVDEIATGRLVSLEADFTRLTLVLLAIVIHGSTQVGDYLDVPNKVGQAFYALAKTLIVKPLSDGNVINADEKTWIRIFKGYPKEQIELAYSKADQRIMHALFSVFPDNLSGNIGMMYRIGEKP